MFAAHRCSRLQIDRKFSKHPMTTGLLAVCMAMFATATVSA
jgi:hypothetical protein